jgi:hypothetical protein
MKVCMKFFLVAFVLFAFFATGATYKDIPKMFRVNLAFTEVVPVGITDMYSFNYNLETVARIKIDRFNTPAVGCMNGKEHGGFEVLVPITLPVTLFYSDAFIETLDFRETKIVVNPLELRFVIRPYDGIIEKE